MPHLPPPFPASSCLWCESCSPPPPETRLWFRCGSSAGGFFTSSGAFAFSCDAPGPPWRILLGVLVDVDMKAPSSAILLITLVGGVLLDVALLPLLVRILRTLLAVRGIWGHLLAVAGSLRAPVLGGNRWHLAGHDAVSCC